MVTDLSSPFNNPYAGELARLDEEDRARKSLEFYFVDDIRASNLDPHIILKAVASDLRFDKQYEIRVKYSDGKLSPLTDIKGTDICESIKSLRSKDSRSLVYIAIASPQG